jgi:asparagine synthase (glutamine-hydrolysing)
MEDAGLGLEVKALVADPDYSAAPDEAMVGEFLLGWSDFPDASATFYRGIRQLPGGHSLTLKDGQLSVRRYWDIDPAGEARCRRSLQENIEEFSALFARAVERQLATSSKVGVLLSGGVDSTSIASWAEKSAAGKNLPAPPSLSLLLRRRAQGDERTFVQSFQERYGCAVDYLALKEWWPLERLIREADLAESLLIDLSWGVTEDWATHLRENGCGVVLTGLGGDNIFPDPGPTFLADVVQRYGWRAGWRSLRRTSSHLGMPLSPFIVPTLRLLAPTPAKRALKRWLGREVPGWMQPDFARRSGVLERVRQAESRRGFSTMSQELDYRHLTGGRLAAVLSYYDRVCARHGFEFRHPFFDPSLVRFTVLAPPEHKTRDGETKVLLREAMDGTLPEAVRGRRDKGALDRFFTTWMRQHDRPAWERIAGNVEGAAAFIKPEKAAEMVRRFFEGDDQALKPAWTLLSLVLWLRNFEGRTS